MDPISTNAVYNTATTKPVKELAQVLKNGKLYSFLDANTQKKWAVQFDHARPVRIMPTFEAECMVGVLIAAAIAICTKAPIPGVILLGLSGTAAIGFPIHEVVMYRKGKKVANEEVPKQEFADMLKKIDEAIQAVINPLQLLSNSIQEQNED
ncbi:MAG: hypothetical protein K940chlam9_00439 [Chlamydiae bacterium]|nr:hypothetical protein [Chlamydiota bacterium]